MNSTGHNFYERPEAGRQGRYSETNRGGPSPERGFQTVESVLTRGRAGLSDFSAETQQGHSAGTPIDVALIRM